MFLCRGTGLILKHRKNRTWYLYLVRILNSAHVRRWKASMMLPVHCIAAAAVICCNVYERCPSGLPPLRTVSAICDRSRRGEKKSARSSRDLHNETARRGGGPANSSRIRTRSYTIYGTINKLISYMVRTEYSYVFTVCLRRIDDEVQRSTYVPSTYYVCMYVRAPCIGGCLLYTSPSPRDLSTSRMPSSA